MHSHLRIGGRWGVYERGRRWGRSPRRAWLVIRTPDHEVVPLQGDPCGATPRADGPVLELMADSRSRSDRRLAALGPDVLADRFDSGAFLARLREDDQTRPVGDALLDQRNLCGVGNMWRSEGCFHAAVDPWRPLSRLGDDEALEIVDELRRRMRERPRGPQAVYNRAGRPCPPCGAPIRGRGQGDDNRTVYWCPDCQR